MTIQRLSYLLNQAENNGLSEPETQELTAWYRSFSGDEGLTTTLSPEQLEQLQKWMWSRIHKTITPAEAGRPRRAGIRPLYRWSAAASVLLLLAAGSYLLVRRQKHPASLASTQPSISYPVSHDASPGGNRATLTLADGTVISLDSAGNGVLSHTGGVTIVKQASGRLVYHAPGRNTGGSDAASYNTLSTPKGGQYRVVLPDGTAAWINAASTLRYPSRFSGKERRVELNGEAYFEVTKDPVKPFIVQTSDMNVRVLGTHFNVMAYGEDHQHIATLLEGSVIVTRGSRQETLKPGQEARVSGGSDQVAVSDADVEEAIAWKDGLFQFEDVDLPTILAQVARWYDIRVVYAGQVPTDLYRGKISRYVPLSKLLKILEYNGAHFDINGNTVTVQ